MKIQFFCPPPETPPEQHEAALLDLAISLIGVATAWRQGTTVTLIEPAEFLDTIEAHIAGLNSHVQDELTRAACRLFPS
jgi:hypothetical protein